MRKEIYLVRGIEKEDYQTFTVRIFSTARELLQTSDPEALKITLTQQAPPKISIIPFKKTKIAVISVYRHENDSIKLLKDTPGFSGAFKVEEALPVELEKTWPDGEPTPGICLLTLFHRKPGIDYDMFINRWHNGHTPLSLKIHPLTNYNRNVVLQKLCDQSVWYDGVVEEQTQSKSDLLNPFVFFGNPLEIIGNMIAVYKDVRSFLDYGRIETYLTMEYHLKS